MLPILYSFRRCPYAMRARLAIMHCGIECELREVVLKNKPMEMLKASPKATVPVLLDGDAVIDESIDIMAWAINAASSLGDSWNAEQLKHPLVQANDHDFKAKLDKYKYFDRFPEHSQAEYFAQALPFLEVLENQLGLDENSLYRLESGDDTPLDIAIFPFIRQFSFVDKPRFAAQALPKLQAWLNQHLESDLFSSVMSKYPAWSPDQDQALIFGN